MRAMVEVPENLVMGTATSKAVAELKEHLDKAGLLPPYRNRRTLPDRMSVVVEGDVNPCLTEDEEWP